MPGPRSPHCPQLQDRAASSRDELGRWRFAARMGAALATAAALMSSAGCTTTSVLLTAAGVATDTSLPWAIVKHVHTQMTDGDPVACRKLNSVERALTVRCGAFEPGSLQAADVARPGLQECALIAAARQPALWPVLPELLDKGARLDACHTAPLVVMAQAAPQPDAASLTPEVVGAIKRLALNDPRSVHHDAMRMLSGPAARQVGLSNVMAQWLAEGRLPAQTLAFSPFGALHPDALGSPLSLALEAQGHRAGDALGGYLGQLPAGFEEALRTRHWAALDWWFARVPSLVNEVPPRQGNQVAWVPLAQVQVPAFVPEAQARRELTEFLLARGADPWRRLPGQNHLTVVSYAAQLKSPLVELLQQPREAWPGATAVASHSPSAPTR